MAPKVEPSTPTVASGLTRISADEFVDRYQRAIGHELDPQQRDAALHGPGPIFIMAGPGSGKSEVIVARALKLVLVDGVDPRSLFVVTFTDKAARNLEDRIADRLSRLGLKVSLDETHIGTLHSLCDRIMRDFRSETYHDTRLLDDVEQSFFIHKELHDWLAKVERSFWDATRFLHPTASLQFGPNTWQRVESFKTLVNRVTEEQVPIDSLRGSGDATLQVLADGLEFYRSRLTSRSRSDFAHVQDSFLQFLSSRIGKAFLQGDPERSIPPLRHVLVDEYQDTNPIQESIYFALAGAVDGNIAVVGDDDQALYRFRGGTVECLVRFPEKCVSELGRSPFTVQLRTNYRSVSEITKWCDGIIAAQPAMRKPGARAPGKVAMRSERGAAVGHPGVFTIRGRDHKSAGSQAAGVIAELIRRGKVRDPSEIAVLLRSTRESPQNAGPVVAELRRLGIPVYNPRSKSFTDAEEVSAMLGGLVRFADPDFQVGGTLAGRNRDSVQTWCAAWDRIATKGTPLATYYARVRAGLRSRPRDAYLKSGLLDVFYRICSLPPFSQWQEDPERTYRLGLLSAVLESFVSVEGGHSFKMSSKDRGRFSEGWLRGAFYPRLMGYFHNAQLDDPEDPDYEIVRGKVQVMTVHQSKGLEFPVVFVDSLMPKERPDDATYQLEDKLHQLSINTRPARPPEERCVQDSVRFYYVAFSRAQDVLCLFGTERNFEQASVALGRPAEAHG